MKYLYAISTNNDKEYSNCFENLSGIDMDERHFYVAYTKIYIYIYIYNIYIDIPRVTGLHELKSVISKKWKNI